MHFRIVHFNKLISTNDYVHDMAQKGAREGLVVVSDYQTKGRGRYERRWVCPRKKGLLFSLLLKPRWPVNRAPVLTQWMAKAVQKTLLEQTGLPTRLKRPNDLMVGRKKLCGILAESYSHSTRLDHVVVGVGLNVTSRERELVRGATSIWEQSRSKINPRQLLEPILRHFEALYEEQS